MKHLRNFSKVNDPISTQSMVVPDIEIINDYFTDIRDEFNIFKKINIDEFTSIMIHSPSEEDFENSYLIIKNSNDVGVTLLIKTSNKFYDVKKSEKSLSNLKSDNYELFKVLENFKKMIEEVENCESYTNYNLRFGKDFAYHHIHISFSITIEPIDDYDLKSLKKFENFNEDSDEDLFINYLQNVTDEYNLFKIKDSRFLRQGTLFINSDNFKEGYFYHSSGPIDRNSNSININRSSFYVTIIKRSYENYPESMSSDKGEYFFRSEYPGLYSDLRKYIYQMRKLHSSNHFDFKDYMTIYLISGREFKFYQIELRFEFRKLKYEETSDYRVRGMLSQLKLSDEEKRKLKEIGYDLDESLKIKNITREDVIKAIKGSGWVFATIIKNFPGNNPKDALKPLSIDDDGLVTIEWKGKEYEVDLEDIEKIDIPRINEGFTIDQRSEVFKIFYNEDYSDEGNRLRDLVLNQIEDILYHFIDEDYKVEVGYGYPNSDELEFKLKPKKYITEIDMKYVQILNDYLKDDGFIPIQSNILKELDIHIYYNNSRIIKSSSLSRFKYMIKGGFKANKIVFKFKIPKI